MRNRIVYSLFGAGLLLASQAFSSVVVQAEARTSQSGTTTVGTYVDMGSTGTAYLEWNNITVSTAGEYKLSFRYGSGYGGVLNAEVRVNDNANTMNQPTTAMQLPSTGGYTTWGTRSIVVHLNAGTNKIRFTSVSTVDSPNLDNFTIYKSKAKYYEGAMNQIFPGKYATVDEVLSVSSIKNVQCVIQSPGSGQSNSGSALFLGSASEAGLGGPSANVRLVLGTPNRWVISTTDSDGLSGTPSYRLEVQFWD